MKMLFSLMILFVITKECNETKNVASVENQNVTKKIQQEENKSIVYTVQSRGLFEEVVISNGTIKVSSGRNSKNPIEKKIPEDEWKQLQNLIGQLDLDKFANLKPPTDKRLYDGATMATLKLIKNDKELSTPTFDHGHPPKAIEALVNKVLSLKETTSKD